MSLGDLQRFNYSKMESPLSVQQVPEKDFTPAIYNLFCRRFCLCKVKQGIEKVTKEDVLRVSKKHLQPDNIQILAVGKPQDFDQPLDTLGSVNQIDITIPKPD